MVRQNRSTYLTLQTTNNRKSTKYENVICFCKQLIFMLVLQAAYCRCRFLSLMKLTIVLIYIVSTLLSIFYHSHFSYIT